MKSRFEIFLDTDIYLDHLCISKKKEGSLLLKSLTLFNCYSSVINASEIFYGCTNEIQLEKAKHSFYGTGVLGIPYKYSLSIAEVSRTINSAKLINSFRDAVVTAICKETRLPLFTLNTNRYIELFRIYGVKLISKELIEKNNSSEIIFKKAKIL